MEKKYGKTEIADDVKLTGKQKVTLILFALTFLIMIIGFIPWGEFGITFFDGFTGWIKVNADAPIFLHAGASALQTQPLQNRVCALPDVGRGRVVIEEGCGSRENKMTRP